MRDELQTQNAYLQNKITALEKTVEILLQQLHGHAQETTVHSNSEHLFRRLFYANPISIVIVQISNGTIHDANEAFCRLIGRTREEVRGRKVHTLGLSIAPERLMVLKSRVKAGKSLQEEEIRVQSQHGTTLDFLISTENIIFGGELCLLTMLMDITQRKQYEQLMSRNTKNAEILARISSRVNQTPELQSVLGVICEEIQQALDVPIVIVSLYDKEFDVLTPAYHIGFPDTVWDMGDTLVRGGDLQLDQQVTIVPNIKVRPWLPNYRMLIQMDVQTLIGVNITHERNIVGLITILTVGEQREVDENDRLLLQGIANQVAMAIVNAQAFQRLKEERTSLARRVRERTQELSSTNAELMRAMRAKDEFLANMSHELRTPLNAILGLAETLQERVFGDLTEKQLSSLQTIESSGRHLLSLINDVLDLSKIEAGRVELAYEQTLIKPLCQASLQFIKQQAHKKKIAVFFEIDEAIDPPNDASQRVIVSPKAPNHATIYADPRRLKQVLINLLTNAVKFTPEQGQVGLNVSADAEHNIVRFSIWDTGIGISPEDQKRLFQPFIQIDSTLSREAGGTGLGLALVMRLVEMHGGSIKLESEETKGSRFTLSLPWHSSHMVEEPPEEEEMVGRVQQTGRVASSAPATTAPIILIAEDNETTLDIFTDYLESRGYQVAVARNGVEALDRAKEETPDLILMDIQMPRMDGFEATRYLRLEKQFASTPIIALTALAMAGDRQRCLQSGVNDYLSKPVNLKKLVQTIETHLKEVGKDVTRS